MSREPRIPGVRRAFHLAGDGGAAERDVDAEIGFHLQSRVDDLVARGHDPAEARLLAEREFGDLVTARSELASAERRMRGRERRAGRLDDLRQDVRYALRGLLRAPLFAAAVILTLALGIGANAAIFSVLDGVLLRPLPYPDADRIVTLWTDNQRQGWPRDVSSYPNFADWREQSRTFDEMAAYVGTAATLTGIGDPERLRTVVATPGLFRVLGVAPALGRPLVDDDMTAGRRVVVLSDGFWRRRLGADPGAVGGTVRLNGEAHEVVGVMPPGFAFPEPEVEAWRPFASDVVESPRGNYWLEVVGRLAPDASPERARAEMAEIARRLEEAYPQANADLGVTLVGLHEYVVGDVRPALLVLMAAVGFVLLIACANVANLLLVRATGRAREMAVRSALGAGRRRIAQQLVVESVCLALVGGLVGLLLAFGGVRLLARFGPADLPRLESVAIDGPVLLFTLGVALLTALLFGVPYGLRAAAVNLTASLKDGMRGSETGGRRMRRVLVVSQLALALVLLVSAGLLMASFRKLQTQDAGFDPDRLLTAAVSLPVARYEEADRRRAFHAGLLQRARAVPGVRDAALTSMLPLTGAEAGGTISVDGRPPTPGLDEREVRRTIVSAGYFTTMGMRLREGRNFTDADGASDDGGVVLINESLARMHFPGMEALGGRIRFGGADSQAPWFTVVGIVADARQATLDAPVRPEMFLPIRQFPSPSVSLVVRTAGDPESAAGAVRRVVAEMDAELALGQVRSMERLWAESLATRRFSVLLLGTFAAVALLLAVVGIYGVMSYAVAARQRELGIRVAVGAQPGQVVGLVLREAAAITAVGLLLGLALTLAATRALASMLYDVSATDPLLLAATALVLGLTAVVASWLPARRAAGADPLLALRVE